ncbi:DUF1653 domain-containing protein [Aliidiomarina taiwanensis]|uniref:DUF1653 domain-containing protein n=1 Tax=Aliidiomarina taiwanensis TaxID=946228 RepID=A0A432X119_9GAMM|nr:DUF1653 domain-containing protein [Aliidiomarina taiwanensis]RUO39842.1 DUF1653 domain-containing protein [Aliidiomarina taiwanensis]
MNLTKGIYQHYKGNKYEVLDVVRHSETEEWLVLYRPLEGDSGLWVRPYDMFTESVEVAGKSMPRFAFLNANHT